MKLVIIGNSGSGKTSLARRLAAGDALADAVRHNPVIAALRLAAETRT